VTTSGERREEATATFVFAFAPTVSGNASAHEERAEPLRHYLEQVLARPIAFVTPASYADTIASLREGTVDAAMLGEFATRHGTDLGGIEPLVAPISADEEIPTYRSVFVTRIDSGIRDLADLRGKEIGLVDEQSTSGYLVPRAMLREAELNPDTDLTTRLYGQHRLVMEAVIAGEVVAGAAHEQRLAPPSLDRGPDYARLRAIARSRPIPLGPLVIRSTLDRKTRDRLATAMIQVHEADPRAAEILIRSGHRFTTASTRLATPTLKSIAALAGVSYATVSRVVNDHGYVAPKTAARVRAVIAEVGYAPNGNARVLQGQQAPIIGVLTPFAGGDAEALVAALGAKDVPLVICPVPGKLSESPYLGLVRDRRLGALIVGEQHLDDPDLRDLARTGHAIIAVGVANAPTGIIRTEFSDAVSNIMRAIGIQGR